MVTNLSHKAHAQKLHDQASEIVTDKNIWQVFLKHGKIVPAGSYALDLLVYPDDLDLYFEPKKPGKSLAAFAAAAAGLINNPALVSMRLEKDLHATNPVFPRGTYWQLKVRHGDLVWQIDIWALEKDNQDAIMAELELKKQKIDARARELILAAKHLLMGSSGKTPGLSSYYVYEAVLDKKLADPEAIKAYVEACLSSIGRKIS